MNRLERAKEIQRNIAIVLLRDWDPLKVRDEPECVDEYDAYVGGVYRALASGGTVEDVAAHLAHVEQNAFGFSGVTTDRLLHIAHTLCELDVTLRGHIDSE